MSSQGTKNSEKPLNTISTLVKRRNQQSNASTSYQCTKKFVPPPTHKDYTHEELSSYGHSAKRERAKEVGRIGDTLILYIHDGQSCYHLLMQVIASPQL